MTKAFVNQEGDYNDGVEGKGNSAEGLRLN